LFRYVFDHSFQVHRHLHAAEGHTLLFFPDAGAPEKGGDRIMLEVDIHTAEQHSLLRGTVHSRVAGVNPGLWLEFPDTRFLRKLEQDAAALLMRKQRRLPIDLMVEIRPVVGRQPIMARLLDVSLGGARLTASPDLRANTEVNLRLISPPKDIPQDLGRARILRAGEHDGGVRFARQDAASRIACTKLFEMTRKEWERARQVHHLPQCCKEGGVIEPPIPRARARDDNRLD
jgi:hypothetical protein